MVPIRKILISNITGYKAVVISTYLKKIYDDIYILGIDNKNKSTLFHTNSIDEFLQIDTQNNYIDFIKELIVDENIDLFIPTHSDEMDLLLQNKSKFRKSLDYFGSYESYSSLNNKISLNKICKKLNINVPKTYYQLKEAKVPFIVKPSQSSASRGVMYVFDKPSYEKASNVYENRDDVIIQEYIEGAGVGYSFFAKDGEIIVGSGHRRMAEYPISGGSSVYRENYSDERMKEISSKIISHLNWSGFTMFEFKLTDKNELFLIYHHIVKHKYQFCFLHRHTSYNEKFDDQTYRPKYAFYLFFYRNICFDTFRLGNTYFIY